MSDSKGGLERSPAEKRALLAQLLEQKANSRKNAPLSFAQQRLWVLEQLDPGSAAYNISRAVRLKGNLNVPSLREALDEIVARHDSLRTNFILVNGQPVQTVHPQQEIDLELKDLRSLPVDECEGEAHRLAAEAAARGFKLDQDRLFRVRLFQIDDDDHVLLLVMHDIVSDGGSLSVLLQEVTTLYEAFSNSRSSPLPPLPLQYTDYARWQHELPQKEKRQAQLRYWKNQLAGAPPVLELPTDRRRPAIQTFAGAYVTIRVDKALTDSLRALSRRENATLFMTLLAAFQVLLYRYTNQPDILVGSPVANRTRPETEGLIGFFVNTLVMRTDLSGEPCFCDLLRQVKQVALDGFAHQDLAFEKLVEELQPERSLSHMPIFQVLFALQNTPKSTLQLGSLELTDFPFTKTTSKLDLSLYVGESEEGLRLSFEYSTELFDRTTFERMAAHFQILLHSIVANPDQRITELPMLSGAGRQQILVDWNSLSSDYATQQLVQQIFEDQVERSPEAPALTFGAETINYRELNRRANQLAHYLKHSSRPLHRCGILLDRSIEMIVAMLAVLKAGAAYVPLDPSYPQARLEFIARDAALDLVVSSTDLTTKWQKLESPAVCIDGEHPQINQESEANPVPTGTSDDLAYVIYTSGSTGEPKGVAVTQGTLVHLWAATAKQIDFKPHDVWTLVHSVAFDFSVWEIWTSLLHGGRLVVVQREVSQSPSELYELIQREQVTVLNQTPAALRQLLEHKQTTQTDWPVRLLICGGDALDQELAADLASLPIPVWNFYGPTENTVWTTTNLVSSASHPGPLNSIDDRCPISSLPVESKPGASAHWRRGGTVHWRYGLAAGY